MALELRNRLEASLGITLPVALVWAYPTITALADALCERMGYAPHEIADWPKPNRKPTLSDEEMELLADLVEASELGAPRQERPSRDESGRTRGHRCRRTHERCWRGN